MHWPQSGLFVKRARLAAGIFLLAMPTPASALDALVEINQTCATLTGCFAGDTPGFPVTITGAAGRAYRLTSDLTLPNASTSGVLVTAAGVDLDLGGFAIRGPVVCSGTPTVCTPTAGSGIGVGSTGPSAVGVSVHDGTISGVGGWGIDTAAGSSVRRVRVRSNDGGGLIVGSGSVVVDVGVRSNGGKGLAAVSSRVADAVVSANASTGIVVSGGTVERCRATQNAGAGMEVDGTVVFENTVEGNGLDGIFDAGGSSIRANVVASNGGNGIDAAAASSVHGNVVRGNGGFGLRIAAGAAFRDDTISSPTTATVSSAGAVDLGANTCNGATTCP